MHEKFSYVGYDSKKHRIRNPTHSRNFAHIWTRQGQAVNKEVYNRIAAMARKSGVLNILAKQKGPVRRGPVTIVKTKPAKKNFSELVSNVNAQKTRVRKQLLQERVEPPVMARGMPNFAGQTEELLVGRTTKNFEHLFSYVHYKQW